jgi:enoyl-CoA hydratase
VSELLRERQGHIEILTLNRPEVRNSINAAMARRLSDAFDELETDDDCWVVVVTGSGDRAFCAGMDLKAFAAGEGAAMMGWPGGFAGVVERTFAKPVIAAVNGPALAGGFEVMLWCDLVIAVEGASFGIPEVTRGLMAAAGGLVRLPKRIPRAVATEMALTGRPIDADRALALGLINRVVPAGRLLDEALALAAVIAGNAPLPVRASKRVMQLVADLPEPEGWAINHAANPPIFESGDAIEGAVAFAEKRPPRWTGK